MMIVDAVFDTHMDSSAVVTRKPRINSRGERPMFSRISRATRRWSAHFSIAMARKKAPKNRKMMWSAYAAATSCASRTSSTGNSTSGTSPVTEMWVASVIHHTPISPTTPATCHAAGLMSAGGVLTRNAARTPRPAKRPINRRLPDDGDASVPAAREASESVGMCGMEMRSTLKEGV